MKEPKSQELVTYTGGKKQDEKGDKEGPSFAEMAMMAVIPPYPGMIAAAASPYARFFVPGFGRRSIGDFTSGLIEYNRRQMMSRNFEILKESLNKLLTGLELLPKAPSSSEAVTKTPASGGGEPKSSSALTVASKESVSTDAVAIRVSGITSEDLLPLIKDLVKRNYEGAQQEPIKNIIANLKEYDEYSPLRTSLIGQFGKIDMPTSVTQVLTSEQTAISSFGVEATDSSFGVEATEGTRDPGYKQKIIERVAIMLSEHFDRFMSDHDSCVLFAAICELYLLDYRGKPTIEAKSAAESKEEIHHQTVFDILNDFENKRRVEVFSEKSFELEKRLRFSIERLAGLLKGVVNSSDAKYLALLEQIGLANQARKDFMEGEVLFSSANLAMLYKDAFMSLKDFRNNLIGRKDSKSGFWSSLLLDKLPEECVESFGIRSGASRSQFHQVEKVFSHFQMLNDAENAKGARVFALEDCVRTERAKGAEAVALVTQKKDREIAKFKKKNSELIEQLKISKRQFDQASRDLVVVRMENKTLHKLVADTKSELDQSSKDRGEMMQTLREFREELKETRRANQVLESTNQVLASQVERLIAESDSEEEYVPEASPASAPSIPTSRVSQTGMFAKKDTTASLPARPPLATLNPSSGLE